MGKLKRILDENFVVIFWSFIIFVLSMSFFGVNQYYKTNIVGIYEAETLNPLYVFK